MNFQKTENRYSSVCAFIFTAAKKVETTQCPSVYSLMDKQIVVYPYNGVLFCHRKIGILIHCTRWMNLENSMLSERSRHKMSYITYSNYMKYPE
jgi:hypothetical protein